MYEVLVFNKPYYVNGHKAWSENGKDSFTIECNSLSERDILINHWCSKYDVATDNDTGIPVLFKK